MTAQEMIDKLKTYPPGVSVEVCIGETAPQVRSTYSIIMEDCDELNWPIIHLDRIESEA